MNDNPISIGDRVQWRSRRRNAKGDRQRTGTTLRILAGQGFAYIRPDKGQGRSQFIELNRLTKVEAHHE